MSYSDPLSPTFKDILWYKEQNWVRAFGNTAKDPSDFLKTSFPVKDEAAGVVRGSIPAISLSSNI